MMTPERWQDIDQLFHAVLERDPAEREAFLNQACDGDEELRREVAALLAADAEADSVKQALPAQVAAEMLAEDQARQIIGQQIGHYKILSQLGAGGMGEIYLAQDTRLGRKVALKLLPAQFTQDGERVRRFVREARAASALNHPNILTIHEISESGELHFIATEFVEGQTLRQRLKDGRMTPQETLDVVIQVASALNAAHAAGIIHRDIKPENIMLRPDGLVKVLDFGLAKLTQRPEVVVDGQSPEIARSATEPGMVMGTARYMSPEQARGLEVDARTDIFSLGVMLYEMIAGYAPFTGATPSDVMAAILTAEPTPLSQHVSEVSPELERVVSKALSKDRDERYQLVNDLQLDLKSLKPASDEATKRLAATRFRWDGWRARRGIFVAAALLAGLLSLLFLLKPDPRQWLMAQRVNQPNDNLDIRKFSVNGNDIVASSLSPDGRYVAYMLGDPERRGIRIRQIATGSSLPIAPLANGVSLWGLRYSRDGDFLYYVIEDINQQVGGMLYRISALGGAPQKLLTGINGIAILSPDGRRMVFKRYDQGKNFLKLANADGSDVQEFDSSASFNDYYGYDWSPSGESIVYINSDQDAEDRYWRIVEKPVNGGPARFWTEKQRREMTAVACLPAGRGLVMIAADPKTRLRQVWHLPAPGAEVQRITREASQYFGLSPIADGKMLLTMVQERPGRIFVAPVNDPAHSKQISPDYAYYDMLAWTPAGEIVYSLTDNGETNLWTMKADGSGRRQLTTDASTNIFPAVSPDGRFIVFVSDRNGKKSLWRMDQDGSHPLQLTREDSVYPHISPDSQWVYYAAQRHGKWSLWKAPITGGEPLAVVEQPSSRPAISPDGRLLAHTYFDEQLKRRRVAVRPLAGGAPLKIFDAGIGYDTLRWTRDGSGVAYIRGANEIVAQPLTGAAPRSLLRAADELIFSFDLSRDGQWVAYLSGRITNDLVLIRDFLPVHAAR